MLLCSNAKADGKKCMQGRSQDTSLMVHGVRGYSTQEQQDRKQFVSGMLVQHFQFDTRQMQKVNFLNKNATHSGQAATHICSTMCQCSVQALLVRGAEMDKSYDVDALVPWWRWNRGFARRCA